MTSIVLNGSTSGALTLTTPAVANDIKVTLPSTSGTVSASNRYRWIFSNGSQTYIVPSDVGSFYVFLVGATGGIAATTFPGGVGGPGYAEKYYNPAVLGTSYSFVSGGAGTNSGTAGGTSTFDTISITGSGGVTTTSGSSGGVATGGDFNASGGTGGNGTSTASGGGGGAGSRAGNGGAGAAAVGSTAGAGGGCGGAASGTTAGAGTNTKAAGALVLPWISAQSSTEYFLDGSGVNGTTGGSGSYSGGLNFVSSGVMAPGQLFYSYYGMYNSVSSPLTRGRATGTTGTGGDSGVILICEILK